MWLNAETFASGLRVPKPYGDYIMLEILKESGGVALSFPDTKFLPHSRIGRKTKAFFCLQKVPPPPSPTTTF